MSTEVKVRPGFRQVELSLVDPPNGWIRMDIDQDEIKELADSIREQGLLSPVEVVPRDGRFEVVFGHRRYLACKSLGLEKIACIVSKRTDKEVRVVRAVENVQRRDLSPIEEAAAYKDLRDTMGMSVGQIARAMGVGPGRVNRRIQLLKMPPKFQKAIHQGKVTYSVAECLHHCPDEAKADYFLDLAIEHGITVAVAKMWVKEYERELSARDMDVDEGGVGFSPMDPVPSYAACDLCKGPFEISRVVYFRLCPDCGRELHKKLMGGGGD